MADKRFPIDYQQKTDPMVEDDVVMLSDSEDLGKIKRVKQSQFKWDTGAKITSATISGDDIVFSLDDSSTATLIDGAKDLKGKDWDEVELRVDSNNIEWKLSQDIARTVLTPLSAIKGDTWAKIVWADWDWNNMKFTLDDSSTVSLVNAKIDLKGDKWDDGAKINWVSWDNNDMKFTLDDASSVSLTNAKTDLKGDTGSTWPVGMQWKWVWIAWSYDKNDWVSYQGSSYIANKNTSQTPWGSDWDILAQQWQAGAGSGDMLASVYDPTNKAVDAFDMDNMVEWTTNKHFTATIATRLANTSWTNSWDEDTTSIKTKLWAADTDSDWYLTSTDWNTFNAKQAALVSGTNIKTVWGTTLLWSGDIPLSGGAWWTITGTLSSQTDLQTALDGKAEKPMRIITKTSSYTLVLADVNGDTLLRMNSASDTTVTIPTNASVASPVGIELLIENIGTGKVTIAWAGWVTVGGDLVLENQNDTRGLVQTSANTWKSYGGSSVVPWENNIGYLNIPANSKSANYTLVLWDAWKSIDHPSSDANARTFTIPSNASVAYPIGTTISFSNMSSQDVTIAITTDTMYLAWDGATGSRTLAQYGVATIRKLTATTRLISWVWLT